MTSMRSRQYGDCYALLTSWCSKEGFFRSSDTVFKISCESASSDTARASAIAPTSALKGVPAEYGH